MAVVPHLTEIQSSSNLTHVPQGRDYPNREFYISLSNAAQMPFNAATTPRKHPAVGDSRRSTAKSPPPSIYPAFGIGRYHNCLG